MLQIMYVNCSYYREKITRRDFWRMKILTLEQQRSEALLSNMLPNSRHAELLMSGGLLYEAIPKATVLQADMVGFTPLSSSISALELYNLLDRLYCKFDAHLDRLGLYKMETIGDAFVVVGGLSRSGAGKTNPAADVVAAIKLAFAMLREVRKVRNELEIQFDMRIGKVARSRLVAWCVGGLLFSLTHAMLLPDNSGCDGVCTGIHTGPAVGGVLTMKKPRYLLWGPAPIIAEAAESSAQPGTVVLTQEARDQIDEAELENMGVSLEAAPHSPKTMRYTQGVYSLKVRQLARSGISGVVRDRGRCFVSQSVSAREALEDPVLDLSVSTDSFPETRPRKHSEAPPKHRRRKVLPVHTDFDSTEMISIGNSSPKHLRRASRDR